MGVICEQLNEMFTLNFFFRFDETEKIKNLRRETLISGQ